MNKQAGVRIKDNGQVEYALDRSSAVRRATAQEIHKRSPVRWFGGSGVKRHHYGRALSRRRSYPTAAAAPCSIFLGAVSAGRPTARALPRPGRETRRG